MNKTHIRLEKTELLHRQCLRPSSITLTICPFQFSTFIHAVSKSNSASQRISPIPFILRRKYNSEFGSHPITLTSVSYDEMVLWQQYNVQCPGELCLAISVQCKFSLKAKCITSLLCFSLFMLLYLYYREGILFYLFASKTNSEQLRAIYLTNHETGRSSCCVSKWTTVWTCRKHVV